MELENDGNSRMIILSWCLSGNKRNLSFHIIVDQITGRAGRMPSSQKIHKKNEWTGGLLINLFDYKVLFKNCL